MTNTPKYIAVKEQIRESIKDGSLKGKIPGERQLAKHYNVSYMTVRRAISELVESGILHKFATKGTFVSHSKSTPKVTKNIGFFLDKEIKQGISSPYYSLVFNALEQEALKIGYHLILFSEFDDLNPVNSMKKIDGVILSCFPRLEPKIQELKKLLPIVLIDNISSDKSIPSVTIDNFNGIYEAVEYLCELNHKRIAFITGLLDSNIYNERILGYEHSLVANGIEPDESLTYRGDYSYQSGEDAAMYFLSLKNPPTAIMCANDTMAIGAIKVVREKGLDVPQDVSIIGFDDIEVSSKMFPGLTTLAAPIEKIAKEAVTLLVSVIEGENKDYKHIILPTELVKRGTCTLIQNN